MTIGDLSTRQYANFRGVDFSARKDEVSLYRSPDALNMWKNYKNSNGRCIETRPDIELLKEYSNTIYGLFFYTINNVEHMILHCGTKLYDINGTDEIEIFSDMNPHKSNYFVFNNILFIKDGINYLEYNGETCAEVEGYIPTTTIGKSPTGGGTTHEDVNLLTGMRKNSFVSDGKAKDYFVDVESFDSNIKVKVWVNGIELTTGYTVTANEGKITFETAPSEPLTTGQDNVIIQFSRTIDDYANRIKKCNLLTVFDNRVFFAGNVDYPNTLFHSSLNNPRYCSDTDYYTEGLDISPIKSMVAGNNALWVLKEPSQANTTVFYHTPTTVSEFGKAYPSTHSSISLGCVSSGINFNDDIVFFSDRGMEGMSGDVTTEQVVAHRSTLVDSKMLNELNYKNMLLEEWEGYLLVIIGKKIYLADSRQNVTINDHLEYEWFYWEFDKEITCTHVKNGVLYLCSGKEMYQLTKENADVEAYWTTLDDEFQAPQYQKSTDKRGCTIDMEGEEVTIYAKTNGDYDLIGTYINTKGYVVPRIKKKKFKSLQLKFYSKKHFGIFSCTLGAYIGSYVKR